MTGILNLLMGTVRSAVVTDPYFEYTTLLLPGSGTNGAQNNSFVDSSANAFPITRNPLTGPNAPTQGTFSPFSQTGWGNYFDGSSYIGNTSTTSVVAAGTSNFTAEFWVYATTDQQSQAYGTVFHVGGATSGAWFIGLLYSSAGAMKIRIGTYAADYDSTSTIAPNRWYHIALVREGTGSNQTKVYVDGSLFHTFTLSDNFSNSSAIYVGTTGFNLAARRLSGYVSNLRFTVGTALYTTAFTPATSPLTTTSQGATASQVEVLTCQSNRFLDNSSNGWTFTTSGSPTVVAFSPFNPTASWSAATNGGSGYFDGSGDYLSVANSTSLQLSNADWTIECWVYVTSTTGNQRIISQSDSNYEFAFYMASGALTAYSFQSAGTQNFAISMGTLVVNQWYHIAATRSGSTIRAFVNGSQVGSATFSGTIDTRTGGWKIGSSYTGTENFSGYITDSRIVKGTAVYTAAFTPPTAPLTAITNTSLLLNFTNAGIYDATSKNDLETVGDAQISNAVTPKWGSTSIKFDGTGDYLQSPDSELVEFGSGDFTIETWVRFAALPSSGAYYTLVSKWDNSTQKSYLWYVYNLSGAYQLYFTYTTNGSTNINPIAAITPSINTWYHYAVSRSGANLRMFIDGTQVGSTYNIATDTIFGGTYPLQVGASTGANTLNGYMQDVRVTKGYARYTANFTAPTAAFPTL